MALTALLVLPTLPTQFAQPVGQSITLKGSPEGRLGGQRATLAWPEWARPLLPLLVRSFALSFAFSWPVFNTIEMFELLFYLSKVNRLRNTSSI